jgi:hypothetical protein
VDHGANRHRPYGPLPMSNHGQVVEAVGADSATNPACDLASQLTLKQTCRPASARRKRHQVGNGMQPCHPSAQIYGCSQVVSF